MPEQVMTCTDGGSVYFTISNRRKATAGLCATACAPSALATECGGIVAARHCTMTRKHSQMRSSDCGGSLNVKVQEGLCEYGVWK
jgi:hypothetical protein